MNTKPFFIALPIFLVIFLLACKKEKEEPATPTITEDKDVKAAIDRGLNLVTVEGGTFAPYNYSPLSVYTTSLSTFKIGKFEVTREFWHAVMYNVLYTGDCPTCPIDNFDTRDLPDFFSKLSSHTGKTYRLPTETEWIYASIGGKQSMGYSFSGSDDPSEVAWFGDNSNPLHPVGQKLPNELGIYDMHGNASEICSDFFVGNEYAVETHQPLNPTGPITGVGKVSREGSATMSDVLLKYRYQYFPNSYTYSYGGFRIVEQIAPVPTLKLGQAYQGGIIVYLDQSAEHGLIIADATQEIFGYEALCPQMTSSPSSSSGLANTQLIANSCGASSTAAGYCYNLNYNGYSDWFLPSLHELRTIYFNTGINFGPDLLMSSFTLAGEIQGFSWNTANAVPIYYPISAKFRPVRSF